MDEQGNARMVDVGGKAVTQRTAVAEGRIVMSAECFRMVREGRIKKGDVLGVAQVAGIQAVKQTANLIPLCHPLYVTKSDVAFELDDASHSIAVRCAAACDGKTGVEMEALTGVTAALLTIYDMCKAADKRMMIQNVHLLEKQGGNSGDFRFEEPL